MAKRAFLDFGQLNGSFGDVDYSAGVTTIWLRQPTAVRRTAGPAAVVLTVGPSAGMR